MVFQDVREAIIRACCVEQVQQKRGKIVSAAPTMENTICFPACWSAPIAAATFTFPASIRQSPRLAYFNCSNYKGNRGTCTSTHYVRVDFLEEVVLGEIRRLTKFASLYEDEFA